MQFKEKRKKNIHLDITPLVDTVFNLLIFFALSLNFTSATSLNINLPEVGSPSKASLADKASIEITKDGEIYFNRQKTTLAGLQALLKHEKSIKNAKKDIVIQADENVTHGIVVTIMDICKKNGFNHISIAADLGN